ncbi:UNVERIFIED_ORG: hypothetical protein ABIB52_003218 [Arthrobacter sp. UYCu721]
MQNRPAALPKMEFLGGDCEGFKLFQPTTHSRTNRSLEAKLI